MAQQFLSHRQPVLHRPLTWLSALAIWSLCGPASGIHLSLLVDDHPSGGPGATGEVLTVPSFGEPGSPLSQGSEAPGVPHLHGSWIGSVSPGHSDPQQFDSNFILGHGVGMPIAHEASPPPMSSEPPSPPPISSAPPIVPIIGLLTSSRDIRLTHFNFENDDSESNVGRFGIEVNDNFPPSEPVPSAESLLDQTVLFTDTFTDGDATDWYTGPRYDIEISDEETEIPDFSDLDNASEPASEEDEDDWFTGHTEQFDEEESEDPLAGIPDFDAPNENALSNAEFVAYMRSQGLTDEDIARNLRSDGVSDDDTARMLAAAPSAPASAPLAPPSPPSPEQQKLIDTHNQHVQLLTGMVNDLQGLQTQLADAERRQATAKANLASHEKAGGALGAVTSVIGGDDRTAFLNNQITANEREIARLRNQIRLQAQALEAKHAEYMAVERRLAIAAIKANPELLQAEQEQRMLDLINLNRSLHTKHLQLLAGTAAFDEINRTIDGLITRAGELGQSELVTQLEADKAKIRAAYDAWLANQQTTLQTLAWDLNQAYGKNFTDGIGAANPESLFTAIRALGADPRTTLEKADQSAVASAGESAARFITAAITDIDEHAFGVGDFAGEVLDTYIDAWKDPVKFYARYGAYLKGVGSAGADAVKDLLVIAKEGAETVAQATEVAVNQAAGSNSNLFGRQNLEALEKFADAASKLDSKMVYNTTQGLLNLADRRLSQQAAGGEKGLRQALSDVGYVTGTVLGVEEIGFRALGLGARFMRGADLAADAVKAADKAADATRAARAGENAAQAGADASRTGPVPDAPGTQGTPAGIAGVADETGTVRLPRGAGQAAGPLPVTLTQTADGLVLTRADGKTLVLKKVDELGAGSSSVTYALPGNDNFVVKVTKAGSADDPTGAALDAFGYRALQGLDPTLVRVPKVENQFPIAGGGFTLGGKPVEGAGGVVTVLERAPQSFDKAGAAMTPGQIDAYRKGIEAINKQGLAFVDNNPGNYGFRNLGGDKWELWIIDPGGIIPMVDADAARALQIAIDSPSADALKELGKLDWMRGDQPHGRGVFQDLLGMKFNDKVNWDLLNRATGKNFSSLNDVSDAAPGSLLPFNPNNGIKNPDLARALAQGTPPPAGVGAAANDPGFRGAPTQVDGSQAAGLTDDVTPTLLLPAPDVGTVVPGRGLADVEDVTPTQMLPANDLGGKTRLEPPPRAANDPSFRTAPTQRDLSASGVVDNLNAAVVQADAARAGTPVLLPRSADRRPWRTIRDALPIALAR